MSARLSSGLTTVDRQLYDVQRRLITVKHDEVGRLEVMQLPIPFGHDGPSAPVTGMGFPRR
jgi:hypothetical protein